MSKPVITLKNVKHSAFASQETNCFEASVYVDGKRFCRAFNEGHGGCDSYHGVSNDEIFEVAKRINPNCVKTHDQVDKSEKHEWPYPDDWYEHFSMTAASVFECAVGDALTKFLIEKDIKNDLRHRWVAVKKGSDDPSLLIYGKKQKAFADCDIDEVKSLIERHAEHEVEIINGWEMSDIRAAYELAEEAMQ